jgi:pimeloyl-ACP methyl ester carboxylesterase
MKKRIALAVLLLFAAFAWFRPMSIYFAARSVYLTAIGARGHDVQVGPHKIHYLVKGDGPPLVVVHGVAMRSHDWAPLYRTLARTHRVYALDLLGYGDSDKPKNAEYSVATQAEIVRGFMDAMELKQADVAGVSMGGWVALKFAAEHPERVRRLVLVSSGGFAFKTTLDERAFSAQNISELRASLLLQSDRANLLPRFVLRDFLRLSKEKAWVVRSAMRSMLEGREVLNGKVQRVTMPVLLVWGTADRIVPFSVAAAMQKEMPQATVVPLKDCGHLAMIECRSEALPAMARFLAAR